MHNVFYKIIDSVENAKKGEKLSTFHYQILLHSKTLKANGVTHQDFYGLFSSSPYYAQEYKK